MTSFAQNVIALGAQFNGIINRLTIAQEEGDMEEFYQTVGKVVYELIDLKPTEVLLMSPEKNLFSSKIDNHASRMHKNLRQSSSDLEQSPEYLIAKGFWKESFNADSPSSTKCVNNRANTKKMYGDYKQLSMLNFH